MQAVKLKNLRDPADMPLPKLDDDARYRAAAEELAALDRRFAEAEQRERVAKARQRGQQPSRPLLDRAKDLLAGGRIVNSSPADELDAAFEEQLILRKAINEKREKLTALRGELSFAVCKKFALLNADALRNAFEATVALFEALEANRVLRGRLIGSGYTIEAGRSPFMFSRLARRSATLIGSG
jgi:hypothetical protein